MFQLFGVFANHSPESCPLNNAQSKKVFIEIDEKVKTMLPKFKINRIVAFYMSVLEHEWTIILEAENAHDIERFCIDAGISAYSTIRIVPLNTFDVALKKMKGT